MCLPVEKQVAYVKSTSDEEYVRCENSERSSFVRGHYSSCPRPREREATFVRRPVRVVVDSDSHERGVGACDSVPFRETFDHCPSGVRQAQLSVINGSIRNSRTGTT